MKKAFLGFLGLALSVASASGVAAQRVPTGTTVSFRNDLPGSFELTRARCWVDGVLRYDGAQVFDIAVAPGAGVVSVEAQFQMRDRVFSYMRGYRLDLHGSENIGGTPPHAWVARAVEVGGVTSPIERRAAIIWR